MRSSKLPATPDPLQVISLGAGVQSSTMALMAAHGEITPMPACAIFADTMWEPDEVYRWLEWLEKELPFPVHRVKQGDIRADNLDGTDPRGDPDAEKWVSKAGTMRTTMPFFVVGDSGIGGPTRRKCTNEYKIMPIEQFIRRDLLGLAKGERAGAAVRIVQWRGISSDEASRMKPSQHKWMEVRYPLAMELGMARRDCFAWMAREGYPTPPRSACIGCPYHSDHEWRRLRDESPEEWADAVKFDEGIRWAGGMDKPTFLHRQLVPLSEVDLDTAEDRGQIPLWGNECEGMCGV